MKEIYKVGGIIIKDGKLLLVRKRGTNIFISPGGKPELDENDLAALKRELLEEVRLRIVNAKEWGTFTDECAFEKNALVKLKVYFVQVSGNAVPANEIEELTWVSKNYDINIGNIFKNHVIPQLISQNIMY